MEINRIEYRIHSEEIYESNPFNLRNFVQALSAAKGKSLAGFRGAITINVSDKIPKQYHNQPIFRAYVRKLMTEPLGLSFFLHPKSDSLRVLAFSYLPEVSTLENEASSPKILVELDKAPLVDFLSADLEIAEALFKRAGFKDDSFQECAQQISAKFNLTPEDWDNA